MQEHIYRPSAKRIFCQTFFIWLLVATQVAANIIIIPKFISTNQVWGILFVNAVLGLITVPSVYSFINYYKYSKNKEFIVTYNTLKMLDTKNKQIIEINVQDIVKIELHQNLYPYSPFMNLAPWSFQEYFCFIDKNMNKIIVTSYFMDIIQFWTDTLTRRVNSNNLVKFEHFLPLIKN